MVFLKNNTGFPVQLPIKIDGKKNLPPKQGVKASAEEFAQIQEKYPLVLKGLQVFNLDSAPPVKKKAPEVKKKSVKKSAVKEKEKEKEKEKSEPKAKVKIKSEEVVADVKPDKSDS